MCVRYGLMIAVLLAGLPHAASGLTYREATEQLNGSWRGEDYVLRVDAERAQASVDPDRPFAWQRFLVKEVADWRVTFTVGAELYQAVIGPDGILLTSTSFRGSRVLRREADSAAGP